MTKSKSSEKKIESQGIPAPGNINRISIGKGESLSFPHDVVSATVFAPDNREDRCNQYAVILTAKQGIKILPGLCNQRDDTIGFTVIGDWEAEGMGDAIKNALSAARVNGSNVVAAHRGRDWLIDDDGHERIRAPSLLELADKVLPSQPENSFMIAPMLTGDHYFVFSGNSRVEIGVDDLLSSVIKAVACGKGRNQHLELLISLANEAMNTEIGF